MMFSCIAGDILCFQDFSLSMFFVHVKRLQNYNAQSPCHGELFSPTENTAPELLKKSCL